MTDRERDELKAEIRSLRLFNAEKEKRISVARAIIAQAGAENPQSEKLRQAWDALRNGPSLEEHRKPQRDHGHER